MAGNFVQLSIQDKVARLILNRPDVLNAIHPQMIEEIVLCLHKVRESSADVLVVSGSGKGFCAGGDIKSMLTLTDKQEFYHIMDMINEMVVTLYTFPKLTISAVHGAAAGLGLSIALATDYVIASEQAIFAMNFIGIGLIPDGGGHFFLANRIGEHKAKQVIWEGRNMSAEDALKLGFIDEITNTKIDLRVEEKVTEWLQKPRKAMLTSKDILAKRNLPLLLETIETEKNGQFEMRQTHDHLEGIKAFMEKRKPVFKGV